MACNLFVNVCYHVTVLGGILVSLCDSKLCHIVFLCYRPAFNYCCCKPEIRLSNYFLVRKFSITVPYCYCCAMMLLLALFVYYWPSMIMKCSLQVNVYRDVYVVMLYFSDLALYKCVSND